MRASLQRELTANLARTGGYEVISFKNYDCLMFSRGETLKMFLPTLERMWMVSPGDRRLSGEIIVAFPDAIKKLRPPSKRYELGDIIFDMNRKLFGCVTALGVRRWFCKPALSSKGGGPTGSAPRQSARLAGEVRSRFLRVAFRPTFRRGDKVFARERRFSRSAKSPHGSDQSGNLDDGRCLSGRQGVTSASHPLET